MSIIIGLVGGAGSGKSTAAKFLCDRLNGTEYILAAPIKSIAMDLYGFTRGEVDGDQKIKRTVNPVIGISPRQGMQRVGDSLRRAFGEDYLVQRVLDQMTKDVAEVAIVSDIRYLNEAACLRRQLCHDVTLIRFDSPYQDDTIYDPHASEQQWRLVKVDHEVSLVRGELFLQLLQWLDAR